MLTTLIKFEKKNLFKNFVLNQKLVLNFTLKKNLTFLVFQNSNSYLLPIKKKKSSSLPIQLKRSFFSFFQTDNSLKLIFEVKSFQKDVIQAKRPVILYCYFFGNSTTYIKLPPLVNRFTKEIGQGEIALANLNIEKDEALFDKLNIKNLPFMQIYYQGQVIDELIGVTDEEIIRNFFQKAKNLVKE
eukprot:TRINITY_DN209_c0_g1_i1.p1 TRINITY_DN209_c0_g1~~TRINITY_DN209_c0_g1_i1.p1  ORF type:complete len:186 (-),score=36.12 TRINITY_DN209_c0_g1_i1:133-690(-)